MQIFSISLSEVSATLFGKNYWFRYDIWSVIKYFLLLFKWIDFLNTCLYLCALKDCLKSLTFTIYSLLLFSQSLSLTFFWLLFEKAVCLNIIGIYLKFPSTFTCFKHYIMNTRDKFWLKNSLNRFIFFFWRFISYWNLMR